MKQPDSDIFKKALHIISVLRQAGHQAFLVGGSVRDLVRGIEPDEYDIVTSAIPDEIRQLFQRTIPVGESFGVILLVENGNVFEVATFRSEEDYQDGRRPSQVRLPVSAREDVLRRDFTINGLLLDPISGEVIDYVGGMEDINKKRIRTIGAADERFAEDHLRILRAVRFSSTMGFSITAETMSAIKNNAGLISNISAERIRDELTKILVRGNSRQGFELLLESGLLSIILPQVASMKGISQPPLYHPEGDVWEHTLLMLKFLSDRKDDLRRDTRLAWGVLLHDIGKPDTYIQDERGIHFYGHTTHGANLAFNILQKLRFPRAEIDTIISMILNHMHFINVMHMRPNRLKRFLRMTDFFLHLELHRLDCLASHGNMETYDFCVDKLHEFSEEELHPERIITGSDLIDLGFTPGPLFSEMIRAVEDAQLDGEIRSKEDAISFILEKWGDLIPQR
jgi:poly(A) polymerase